MPASKFLLAIVVMATGCAARATAGLLSVDDGTFGSGAITRDTATRLDWLDVPLSLGRSYDGVMSEVGPSGLYAGFRFATRAELETLFYSSAGISNAIPRQPSIPQVVNLQTLVGVTSTSPDGVANTSGVFDDSESSSNTSLVGVADLAGGPVSSNTAALFDDSRSASFSFPLLGSWLVRPVPEPTGRMLLVLGLLLTGRRRVALSGVGHSAAL